MTTTNNPISSSSSSSANSKKSRTYIAAMYSIVAAVAVLVIGTILKDSILILPAFLIGIMAIACTGQVILDVKRHPHHRFSKF
jgi:ABC-type Mn2+/Zn2+ transport system permease subunit